MEQPIHDVDILASLEPPSPNQYWLSEEELKAIRYCSTFTSIFIVALIHLYSALIQSSPLLLEILIFQLQWIRIFF